MHRTFFPQRTIPSNRADKFAKRVFQGPGRMAYADSPAEDAQQSQELSKRASYITAAREKTVRMFSRGL